MKVFISFLIKPILFAAGILWSLSLQAQPSSPQSSDALQNWIFESTTSDVEGLGVANYSQFNPEKSWSEALQRAVSDLNANHSLIVSHYGYRIGRGPLRIRSDYAMRTFFDSTKVTVIDSARWKGRAFIRVKPATALPDSLLYPNERFRAVDQNRIQTVNNDSHQWLLSTGSTPRIDSNWYMSITKAKQDALRKLAEDLTIKVTSETYSKGATTMSYYSFSTLFAFQRVRVLKREFNTDSIRVQVAIHPREIKKLMD